MMMILPTSSDNLLSLKFNKLNQIQEVKVVEGEQDVDVVEVEILKAYTLC